ncbi:efflux RND transporter periplasmic adaptor subunit [Klebsiella quasivariicola]|uniref:efflux RND transporter periplasmic adaptor subunit n=1 Tax=Klebsiella quasivariicola TaxID=2026240 RepID=UPI0018A25BB5|nr:efflux RND transporter periplasmic adaptor subunit [Klebsiella quasivariicola]MBF7818292.1 efflux RND transporter periplasmic adaptor subunit [Klebsiella quasivariicola]
MNIFSTTFINFKLLRFPFSRKKIALALFPLLIVGCDGATSVTQEAPPVSVESVTVKEQPFKFQTTLPGRIEPLRVAEVRARVAGIVLSRDFQEGTMVKAGQILYQIDPASFRMALSSAQGDLARADAAVSDAEAVLRRYKPLVKIDAVSRQDFDNAQTALKSAQATRQSAHADVQTAELNLDYATVRAPISGRIGRALVTEGALVGQNEATPLATIQQIDSVYADFQQPVAEAQRLRSEYEKSESAHPTGNGQKISLSTDGSDETHEGRLLFSDITVSRDTGQFLMRGEFPNKNGALLPGMYVRIHLTQAVDPDAILIPQRAVHRDSEGGAQVFVIGADNVVEERKIRTGVMKDSRWQIIHGLKEGDRVVTGGTVSPGLKVTEEKGKGVSGNEASTPLNTALN